MFKSTSTSASAARVAVSWSNADRTDYLAGGYWLHVTGQSNPFSIRNVEIGAFMDGPELSGSPNMPIQGQADYVGLAAGLYAGRVGDGFPGSSPPGSTQAGEFASIITLTADFGNETISGCVGCAAPIYIDGIYRDGVTGETYPFAPIATEYRVLLDPTPFDSNGRFRSRNVRLVEASIPNLQSSGTWGGRFSNKSDSTGQPRLVAGTLGGHATIPDGSESAFVGAWFAGK